MSAFTENRFSKHDIIIAANGADSVVFSPGIQKLPGDDWQINTQKGLFANWGLMDQLIGEIGLGLIFNPEEYAGYAENDTDRFVRLKIPAGKKSTHYVIGGWEMESYLSAPIGDNRLEKVEKLRQRLNVVLEVKCKDLATKP